jgi:hypothetical protein
MRINICTFFVNTAGQFGALQRRQRRDPQLLNSTRRGKAVDTKVGNLGTTVRQNRVDGLEGEASSTKLFQPREQIS